MNYNSKTVVVTGAAKGIGAATAKLFYEAGANVALLDVAEDPSGINNKRWLFLKCDVSKEAEVKTSFEKIETQFGGIDFLINNAGIQRYGTVTETETTEWDLVMNVNLKSFFLCAKYAIPSMQKNNKGVIINVASVQAFLSQQKVAAYTTAKT